jgi:hypothetical protein
MARGVQPTNPENLTVPEVAKRLRCSVETLRAMRERGDGPPFLQLTPRGRILYPREQYDEWRRTSSKTKSDPADEGEDE